MFDAAQAIVEASKQSSLGAFYRQLGIGYGREPGQRLLALGMLSGKSENVDRTEFKLRSAQMLRGGAEALLRRSVSEIRSASQCGLAREIAVQEGDDEWRLKATCVIREGICVHEDRIGRDIERWTAAGQALQQSEKKNMGATALKMAADARVRTGSNCYRSTGDVSIALDCRPDETLVTTDASFEIMAPALGFKVERIATAVQTTPA